MSRIVTFYSYKGGVGRTFALANIAVLLTKMGKRVLVMDWDLEAPGLHRYFEKYQNLADDQKQGLIHLLCEVEKNPEATWKSYLTEIIIPDGGSFHLLPSGDQAPDYVDRVNSFSWQTFFAEEGGGSLLDKWRAEWKSNYDFVLVDSRTGITDAGGVCTIYLPDILVLAFAANEQSFSRGIQVVAGAQNARRDLSVPRAPLAVLPLPGKFVGRDEVDDAQMWMARFAKDLKPFYEDWLPKDMKPQKILELTKIPYITKFSFGEPLPVVTQGTTDPEFPGFYLQNVADLLESDFRNARHIIDPDSSDRYTKLLRSAFSSDGTLDHASIERLIAQIRSENGNSFEAAEALSEGATLLSRRQSYQDAEIFFLQAMDIYNDVLGPEHPEVISITRRLAGMYREMGRLDDALLWYMRSLEQSEKRGHSDDPAILATYNNMAGIYRDLGSLDDALHWYKRSLVQSEKRGHSDDPAILATCNNIAGIYRDMGRLNDALEMYKRVFLLAYKQSRTSSIVRKRNAQQSVIVAHNNIANTYHEMDRLDDALEWYRRALTEYDDQKSPAFVEQLIKVAEILLEKGDAENAEETLINASEVALKGPWSKNEAFPEYIKKELAMLLKEVGREEEALTLTKDLQFDVCILYKHKDWEFVSELAHRIQKRGIEVRLDRWILNPGSGVDQDVADELGRASSILYCIGREPSLNNALELVLSRYPLIIPVLLPNADSNKFPEFLFDFQFIRLHSDNFGDIPEASVDQIVAEIKRKNIEAVAIKKNKALRHPRQQWTGLKNFLE